VRALLLVAASLVGLLAAAGRADAGRYAVGLEPGASAMAVEARLAGAGARVVSRELRPLGALTVEAARSAPLVRLRGVAYVERLDTPRRLAFTPNDPLAARQWYLQQVRAFDAWAEEPPGLAGVLVAIIDSGVDAGHPDLADGIVAGKSFVGGDWRNDSQGHGTFVAGIIGARTNDAVGIAGMALGADLLVAKVVGEDRTISLEAEAKAMRWAIAQGARVINLSLGGLRDPFNRGRDTYSPLEAAAVAYAVKHGAVVIAAVGNADQAPKEPWPFASYPAALPHVLGVSALARDGSIPTFSDRDPIFNDLSAPGEDIFSTLPRALTAEQPACKLQGYSECGSDEYQRAEGTSFAAPQAAAAAALVLGVAPTLTPDQVTFILTRTAADVSAATGCKPCPAGRDALAGWGRLDVTEAVRYASTIPPPEADQRETNDDAGDLAPRVYGRRGNTIRATIDFWDDETDVYRVQVRAGQRLAASLSAPPGTRLFLWRPGTKRVSAIDFARRRVAQSVQRGSGQRLVYRPGTGAGGWYYLQVRSTRDGGGPYVLSYTKR
jgi:subtilisin family serine protease